MLEQSQKCDIHCVPLLSLEVCEQMSWEIVLFSADGLVHSGLCGHVTATFRGEKVDWFCVLECNIYIHPR